MFAWCGGAVLLRADYLVDVGTFDERFFLYYEDTDLSWRGRHKGWRYQYVPRQRRAPRARGVERRRRVAVLPLQRRPQPAHHPGQARPQPHAGRGGAAPVEGDGPPARLRGGPVGQAPAADVGPGPAAVRLDAVGGPALEGAAGRAGGAGGVVAPRRRRRDGLDGQQARAAVYDRYWSTLGGGEQVAGAIAAALAERHDVELLGLEEIDHARFAERMRLDLSGLPLRVVDTDEEVSAASLEYDLFVNCTYLSPTVNRAKHGLYYVHFPGLPGGAVGRKAQVQQRVGALVKGRTIVVARANFLGRTCPAGPAAPTASASSTSTHPRAPASTW